jgi:S-adenosylmethionine synthetase
MNVLVTDAGWEPMNQRPMEMVERKGLGHPDTICDCIAEELSRRLSCYYLEQCGRILHHNVDKALLVGGQTEVWFGGGRVLEPMRLVLSGRATVLPDAPCVLGEMALAAARDWLHANLPDLPDEAINVDYLLRPGSAELRDLVENEASAPRANDTSLGVAHAPLSETERLVLAVEETVASFGPVGRDIKIMALRRNDRIDLTIAAAFVASRTPDLETYTTTKAQIEAAVSQVAQQFTSREVVARVNCGDLPAKGRYYLTLTGTSAEAGDDGQVGRGNRANGLITPFRPMSIEAVAGKNPVSHIGKIYNVMAQRIADRLVEQFPQAEVVCYMLSQIGAPITEPVMVHLEVAGVPAKAVEGAARQVTAEVLDSWREIQRGFLAGSFRVA